MAIVKMIGSIEGNEVVFRKSSGGLWTAAIPKELDGEYVVSVNAYDEAGNQTHASSMLFTVDPSTLKVDIPPLNFAYKITKKGFTEKTAVSDFTYQEAGNQFNFRVLPRNYKTEVV